jgi:diguanylate cyclase (GGDEF)-like protein/PAS domain S-box-containing protein
MNDSSSKTHQSRLRVLFIEDNPDDALIIVDLVEASGFELHWHRVDSEQALREALNQSWDLIFSDYSMPGFSGERAFEIVSEVDLDSAFIFLSGTIGEDAAVTAMKAGANDYIMKSNLNRLLPTVSRELREIETRRLQKRTQETLKKLSLAVNQSSDSILITDTEGEIEYVNPAFERMTGYLSQEVLNHSAGIFDYPLTTSKSGLKFWQITEFSEPYLQTFENRRKNNERYYEERLITPLFGDDGKISNYVVVSRDITSRVMAEDSRKRLSEILEVTPDIVIIIKPPGELLFLNSAGYRLLGIDPNSQISGACINNLFPKNLLKLYESIAQIVSQKGSWTGETILYSSTGIDIPVSVVALSHQNSSGTINHISMIARDISERKNFEEVLQYRATHDHLTGLPNRFFLMDRLKSALLDARRNSRQVAVLFIDLDNFKRVNDSFGHAAGDQLLRQVAERLKSCLRPNDTIARNGGDEFTVVISDLPSVSSVLAVITKLCHTVEVPIYVEGKEIYVSFSTGVAIYPEDGESIEELLKHADIAMYQAKNSSVNQYRLYNSAMNSKSHELFDIEALLRRAIIEEQFELFYQPQICTKTGIIVAAEALIRWHHPERGLIYPAEFISILEATGLIVSVGEWVIRRACNDLRILSAEGYGGFRVAANVSAAQFNDKDFIGKVTAAINESAFNDMILELEITENTAMKEPDSAVRIIKVLQSHGVRIAIDDFGTGYSSLGYLKMFPINLIKIDQIFVKDLDGNLNDSAIVDASSTLSRKSPPSRGFISVFKPMSVLSF